MTVQPLDVKYIIAGQYAAVNEPLEMRTVLGSCVAACLYDPEAGVGGMNHFLLPSGEEDVQSARYGCYAMELLITDIMKRGGDRRRLLAKIFGGAAVLSQITGNNTVGDRNVAFIRSFLEAESMSIVAESVGGRVGMRVHYWPHNGRAFIQRLASSKLSRLREREAKFRESLQADPKTRGGDITLF